MYAKCGSLEDAWIVFNKMPSRDVVSWNAMILGHVKCGQGQKALKQMQQEGVQPNYVTFAGLHLKRVGVFITTLFKVVWR
jgi:pentatricopeptide repeat protein